CDTSLADTAAACASVLDIITQDTECRVHLRQCTQAEADLPEDINRIRPLVSDDVIKVLQEVEDRMAYGVPPYHTGIFYYPWTGWEIEQAISREPLNARKVGVAFLRNLSSEVQKSGVSDYEGSPAKLLCLSDPDNLRMLIHNELLLHRCRRIIGEDYPDNDPRQALLRAFRDEMFAEMRRQQYEDTDNVIFGGEAPLLCFFMSLLTPATEPELRLAVYDYLTSVMPHVLCLSMKSPLRRKGYDASKSNSTLDQFIRKGYHDVVLPMAGEMLPQADMTEDDIFDQTSNWARGISYVHNIFCWPATDPARLALDRYFVEHIETAEALVTTGQQLASALAATECIQLWGQEDLVSGEEGRRTTEARARPDETLRILATIPEGLLFRLPRLVEELQTGSVELQAVVAESDILMGIVSAGDSEDMLQSGDTSEVSGGQTDARNTSISWEGSQMLSDAEFWRSIPSLRAKVDKYIQDDIESSDHRYYGDSDYEYYGYSRTDTDSDTDE
ncbi:hypothetical protein KIPB_002368, partial [Kipferlia bialata]